MAKPMKRVAPLWQSNEASIVVFVALVLTSWFLATHWFEVSPLLVPDPLSVFPRLAQLIVSMEWWDPLVVTASEVLSAFALSSVLGIALSFVLSRSVWWVKTFDPLLNGINAVPAILFFPLFALLFGLGPGSKIALGFTISFFHRHQHHLCLWSCSEYSPKSGTLHGRLQVATPALCAFPQCYSDDLVGPEDGAHAGIFIGLGR